MFGGLWGRKEKAPLCPRSRSSRAADTDSENQGPNSYAAGGGSSALTGVGGTLSLALAAPPSLRTTVVVESLDPAVVAIPAAATTLVFPAGDIGAKVVVVVRAGHGQTVLRAKARSPGLLEQLSVRCGDGGVARCASAFAPRDANRTL
jgi:hypothetical protein